MRYRHRVSGFLVLLFAITYIDRVCISIAGSCIPQDLGIDSVGWGWVNGDVVSSIAYGYLVSGFGTYNAPFIPMAVLLFLGTALWFKVDAAIQLRVEPVTVVA